MNTKYLAGLLLFWLIPLTVSAGQLAIIIDDLGYNAELGRRTTELPGDITLAILPFTPHAQELAERAQQLNKEIIVHAPMSNHRGLPLGEGGLESGVAQEKFQLRLEQMLAELPQARGLNNHMGSKLTQERLPMGWLMAELAERGLYFVDSRTSSQSVALEVAREHQVPGIKRDVFLDNQRNSQQILHQLHKALSLAQKRGKAVAIGHPYPETLAVLENLPNILIDYNITLVRASQLLEPHRSSSALLECPAPPRLLWRPLNLTVPQDPPSIPILTNHIFSYEP